MKKDSKDSSSKTNLNPAPRNEQQPTVKPKRKNSGSRPMGFHGTDDEKGLNPEE